MGTNKGQRIRLGVIRGAGLLPLAAAAYSGLEFTEEFPLLVLAAVALGFVLSRSGGVGLLPVPLAVAMACLGGCSLGEVLFLAVSPLLVWLVHHRSVGARETILNSVTSAALAFLAAAGLTSVFPELQGAAAAGMAGGLFLLFTGAVSHVAHSGGELQRSEMWRRNLVFYLPPTLLASGFAVLFRYYRLDAPPVGLLIGATGILGLYYVLQQTGRQNELIQLRQQETAARELRILQVFALAIGARERTNQRHLDRVSYYCLKLAEALQLKDDDREALRRAALLHDIGVLAVPEHILANAGGLSLEEFEKMKIHCEVGADMLEQMELDPRAVAAVRCHHERWDGQGYPKGMAGTEIPLHARILSVADAFDALTGERPYRPAMSVTDAAKRLTADAGSAFDPQIIALLRQHYAEWEAQFAEPRSASEGDPDMLPGEGRPARAEEEEDSSAFQQSISQAGVEAHGLLEVARRLGTSLSLTEALSAVSVHLSSLIPSETIAIFLQSDNKLVLEYVHGLEAERFEGLRIPSGMGVAGWVASNDLPILNGDPNADLRYSTCEFTEPARLQSVLCVPLDKSDNVRGALALYHSRGKAFTPDHLRILRSVTTKVTATIENALKFKRAEDSAVTDYLTQLPNSRSLFTHLEAELARCRRTGNSLAVLVCDLDGFKAVNDTMGHLAGNKLLQAIGEGLQRACRQYDYVARLGGDEFVVVLPGIARDGLRDRAMELARIAVQASTEITGKPMVSMSIGPAFYPQDATTVQDLIECADRRMYQFKERRKAQQQEERIALS